MSALSTEDREFVIHQPEEGSFEDDEDAGISGEILQKCLNNLDNEFRNIIILRDIQELSYEEISKIVNVPLGTVKSRINRARIQLRKELIDLK